MAAMEVLASEKTNSGSSRTTLLAARLFAGLIVLICAEVLSGASLQMGLWHPWVWLVTYWLYFAHFFFFTSLAVRTGTVSLSSLYLWGVLFGLYESWITKVIWYGYSGNGSFGLGRIGPFGYSEISMVFFFHPVASFLLPLSIICVLSPAQRVLYPSLAWLTGTGKRERAIQTYCVVAFATTMGMNSGGTVNLIANIAFAALLLVFLAWRSGPALSAPGDPGLLVFGKKGIAGLGVYLLLLYGVTYVLLRAEGRPSIPGQLFTLVFYMLAIAGVLRHKRLGICASPPTGVEQREKELVKRLTGLTFGLALILSLLAGHPALAVAGTLHLLLWTPLGFLFAILAFFRRLDRECRHG